MEFGPVIRYRYRAVRGDGARLNGVVNAPSDAAAAALLSDKGLTLLDLNEHAVARAPVHAPELLAGAFSGMAALLEAGLPADRALDAAAETGNPRTRALFAEALQRVREGSSFATALDAAGGVPPNAIGMLRAGEAQGRLAAAARRVAETLERRAELRAQVRAALTYPVFLAAAGSVSVVLIVGFVIPKFATLLADNSRALPASTRMLLRVSSIVEGNWVAIVAVVLLLLGGTVVAARSPKVQAAFHRELLGLPIVGSIRASLATAGFCRSLSGLLDSGVPMLAALDLVRAGTGDLEIRARLAAARTDVSEGSRLHASFSRRGAMTSAALQLLRFGEESGQLSEFLAHAARLEDAAATRAIRGLVAALEPALIVTFGAVVAFVAAALLQAVYSVRPAGF